MPQAYILPLLLLMPFIIAIFAIFFRRLKIIIIFFYCLAAIIAFTGHIFRQLTAFDAITPFSLIVAASAYFHCHAHYLRFSLAFLRFRYVDVDCHFIATPAA